MAHCGRTERGRPGRFSDKNRDRNLNGGARSGEGTRFSYRETTGWPHLQRLYSRYNTAQPGSRSRVVFPPARSAHTWHVLKEVTAWDLIFRGTAVYVFLLVLLRMTGKRQVGQLAPFDLVLLLVLSNAVQNSMTAGDNSLVGGLIVATTLVVLNYVIGVATYRSKTLEALIEGRPEVLIHNGHLYENVMARAKLTHHELNAALRQGGCSCLEEVRSAILENNGSISVVPREAGGQSGPHAIDMGPSA